MQSRLPPAKTARIVIVGAGETAEIAYEYFTYDSAYEVAAFAVEAPYRSATQLFGLPIVAFEDVEGLYPPHEFDAFVAVSYVKLNRVRARLYTQSKLKGYRLASYVSSRAFVWSNVVIGDNCFILEQNVLQYSVTIGNDVVMWSGNHVGHRSRIHDHCFVSSHVVISGYCDVGAYSFLGVNSCIADHVKVADNCLIGMGAVVQKDTEDGHVYPGVGSPGSSATSFAVFKVKPHER